MNLTQLRNGFFGDSPCSLREQLHRLRPFLPHPPWTLLWTLCSCSTCFSWGLPLGIRIPGSLIGASQEALVVKNLPANAGDVRDVGSIPGLGRCPGGGNGNPLQYFCFENPMDRGTRRATVHVIAISCLISLTPVLAPKLADSLSTRHKEGPPSARTPASRTALLPLLGELALRPKCPTRAALLSEHTSSYCASLYCSLQMLRFLQIEGLWPPCIEHIHLVPFFFFPAAFAHFVSVSYFGNSPNISNPPPAKSLQSDEDSDDV